MQITSAPYRAEMARTIRDRQYIRVTFGIVNLNASGDASLAADDSEYFSRLTSIPYNTGVPKNTYATFEKGRMRVDGSQLVASEKVIHPQGWASHTITDEGGIFQQKPVVSVRFSQMHTCPGLTFTFDESTRDYPEEIIVDVYQNSTRAGSYTLYPDDSTYIFRQELPSFNNLRITYVKGKPYHRARLQQLLFGIGLIFTNTETSKATQIVDIDPVMRRIEDNTFEFTIINEDGMYDPDRPRGVWDWVDQQQPVTVDYGQNVRAGITWADARASTWANARSMTWENAREGRFVEWVNGSRYVLTGQPEASGMLATFHARSRLMSLVDQYHKGDYAPQGVTLYDLALRVINDANIPPIYEGELPYVLHNSLRDIRTTAPLPKTSHRECLHYIAHAAGLVAYTDRRGVIRLEPIDDAQYDFEMNFDTLKGWPDITKTPPLKGVRVLVYSYKPATEPVELHKATYSPGSYMVEFDFAANLTITGATLNAVTSGTAQFTVATRGEVIISGRPIEASTSSITALTGIDGEMEEVDNPLMTDRSAATALANHIKNYLQYRVTYECEYRGNPEVDCMDKVHMQSRYDPRFTARILKHELTFDGALYGTVVAKRMVSK